MSTETYKPGDLAMVREPLTDDEPVLALFDGNGWYGDRPGAVWGQGAATVVRLLKAVPADAIVLDPENFYVRGLLKLNEQDWDDAADVVVGMIRAQVTPPEPPMEEPQHVGALAQMPNGDIWARQSDGRWTNLDDPGSSVRTWAYLLGRNPRLYENPREKPATGAESDAQGSAGGIGRVSDSEAGERAQAHAEAWVEWGKRARGEDRL